MLRLFLAYAENGLAHRIRNACVWVWIYAAACNHLLSKCPCSNNKIGPPSSSTPRALPLLTHLEMASPAASVQSRANRANRDSVRLPKRKTRTSGDTERATQPRKRSKISEDVFTTVVNNNGDETANGYLGVNGERRVSHTLARREKRQTSATFRHAKSEGSGQVLVRVSFTRK
jgi:hypothetical protein